MNRKITSLFLLLFTGLIILFLIVFCTPKRQLYSNIIINENDYNDIINSRKLSEESLVRNLKFNGYKLFEAEDGTYYYSMIEEETNMYNPIIDYLRTNGRINIAAKTNITQDTVSRDETIELLVYTKDEYNILKIKCTTLPILNIDYEADSHISSISYTQANIYLFDNRKDASQRVITSDAKYRYRGATSLDYAKKPYRLSLYTTSLGNNKRINEMSLLGMEKSQDYVLYAAYNDEEKVRNVLSSELWYEGCAYNNSYGIENGTRYKYIELFFNHKYWGLYAIGNAVSEDMMQLKESSNDNYSEYMFKKYGWARSEYTPYANTTLPDYGLVSSSLNNQYGWDLLKEYYYKLLYIKDTDKLRNMSDLKNSIDIYLFYNLVQARDNVGAEESGVLKNTYITLKEAEDGSYKVLYTPWDLDLTFGASSDQDAPNITVFNKVIPEDHHVMTLSPVYMLLKNGDATIRKEIKTRYNELRKDKWSDTNVISLISEYEDDIYNSGAFLRDKKKWPSGNYNSADEKLSNFKVYVLERLKYMDAYIKGLK